MLSKEKPWLKYYPEEIKNMKIPNISLNSYLKECGKNTKVNDVIIEYYGNHIRWNDLWNNVEQLCNALYNYGIKEGDQIPVFLHAVPEFIYLLLAAERLGASVLCRDGTTDENIQAVEKSGSKIVFLHDYHPYGEIEKFKELGVKDIIYLSPLKNTKNVPNYVMENLLSMYNYQNDYLYHDTSISYHEFIRQNYQNKEINYNNTSNKIPLLRAYTTGTTGTSKQVIHSAETIIGVLQQMNFYSFDTDFKFRWLHTVLPPSLVAVTVSMMLSPLASGKTLILDPFVHVNDIDLSLLYNKPNGWAMIPMYTNVLLNSERLEHEDLSFFMAGGTGAEFLNNKRIKEMQEFFKNHNSPCQFTTGYGMSEAGSNCTIFSNDTNINDFCYGIPLPLTTISIFEPGTENELNPGELGEICINGPGVMVGYDDEKLTNEVIWNHKDGLRWLHTGDIGYMNENGHVYCLNRGFVKQHTGNSLFVSEMENKIIDSKSIKDAFFITVEDKEHKGFYEPYLYIVKDEKFTEEEVKKEILSKLEKYEYPKEIIFIDKRPFFHFKTARKLLVAGLV